MNEKEPNPYELFGKIFAAAVLAMFIVLAVVLFWKALVYLVHLHV